MKTLKTILMLIAVIGLLVAFGLVDNDNPTLSECISSFVVLIMSAIIVLTAYLLENDKINE